jgi:DNA-directed RNA polymerase specialized sigma24 family protein
MHNSRLSETGRASKKRQNARSLFTQTDYLIVRRAMDELPLTEKLAVEMRFFHNCSIKEIALLLGLAWDEAEALIESALAILKKRCMDSFAFSRERLEARAA